MVDRIRAVLRAAVAVAFVSNLLPGSAARSVESEMRFTVVVSVFDTAAEAQAEVSKLRAALPDDGSIRAEEHDGYWSVRVGYFPGAGSAVSMLRRIEAMDYDGAWIGIVAWPLPEPPKEPPATVTDTDKASGPEKPAAPVEPPPAPDPEPQPPATVTGPPSQAPAPAPAPAPPVTPPSPPQPPAGVAPPPQPSAKRIQVARLNGSSVVLDGRLDDAAWASAPFVTGFEQKGETRGYPSPAKTEVAFLYDDEALYVGARMQAGDGAIIRAPRTRRDDAADADRIIVSLDTFRDRQTAFNFGVTAGGTLIDFYQPVDVYEVRDMTYDPVWNAKTSVDGQSWTAEMRVPFSSLEFHRGDEQIWGVNLQHISVGERQYEFWVVVPASESGWSSRFGELVGLSGVKSSPRISVTPYAVGERRGSDGATPNVPGENNRNEDTEWRYGGDIDVDFSSGLSLAATINPDFGQIEADPAALNLSDYEIFFPEKRPFFVQDAQLLQGTGPRYYYSRRVGAPPHADFQDEFDETGTTILGATKLVGRLRNGWSLGTLAALTDDEEVVRFDELTQTVDHRTVEPRTGYLINRVQRDLGAGSTFGAVVTGMGRDFSGEELLESLLPEQAFAGGIDWNLRFANQTHEFGGFLGGSFVEGSAESMIRLQTSSARYFQRPDADYVDLDPGRTQLDGYTGGLRLGRIQGPWRWTVLGEARSPGFEINDVGAMATADDLTGFAQIAWGRPFPSGTFQRVDIGASVASGWNFGNVRQYMTPALDVSLVWHNFWKTYLRLAHDTANLSDSLTRGGPLMGTPQASRGRFGISSNDAKRIVWSFDGSYGEDEFGGWSYTAYTQLLTRRGQHLMFSIAPGYERGLDSRQYYSTRLGGLPETFGNRYIFAELDRRTVYARLRAGLAVTPTLSLDLYVEPFVASGTYASLGELARAGGSDLRIYGEAPGTAITRLEDRAWLVTDGADSFVLDNADFDLTSYRSNVVLRWEYLPGSTLFFVWSQNRVSEDFLGDPVGAGDLVDVFDAPAEDIYSLKATFRLGPR